MVEDRTGNTYKRIRQRLCIKGERTRLVVVENGKIDY